MLPLTCFESIPNIPADRSNHAGRCEKEEGCTEGPPDIQEDEAFERGPEQYYQGVSVLDLSGLGCGRYLLGTPGFTFQSPLDGVMRFEVMSGTEGLGTGGIRLCVPRKSGESLEDSIDSPVFMVPFRHVGQ